MLYILPTPIGNLNDTSLRVLNILRDIDIIFCEDTRVTKKLLQSFKSKFSLETKKIQFISMHMHNEKDVLAKLSLDTFEQNIAYMSDAGMPSISDPGASIISFAQKNSIKYEVIPGSNAALLAYTASGFCNSKFLFYGFLPHKQRLPDLERAMNSGYTTILYEAPHRIVKLIDEIVSLNPNINIFCIKEATKLHETKLYGTAQKVQNELKSTNTKGEWCVVIDSQTKNTTNITTKDIQNLEIPKKQKAKLLSKISGTPIKECYENLMN